jgi:hypothetical protein
VLFHGFDFAAEKIDRQFRLKKHKLAEGWGREEWGIANLDFSGFSKELG